MVRFDCRSVFCRNAWWLLLASFRSYYKDEARSVVWLAGVSCIDREKRIICDLKVMYKWQGVAEKGCTAAFKFPLSV